RLRRLRPGDALRDDPAAPRRPGRALHRLPRPHPPGRPPAGRPALIVVEAPRPLSLWERAGVRAPCERSLDWVELAYVGIALFVGLSAWAALLLGELALFLAPIALLVGAAGALWALRGLVARPSRLAVPGALPLLVLGAVVFFRPHEYVLGGL